jgi:ABC-type nitrate/sulfonate/bicarbonate transport system substrate-binding protein
MKYGFRGSLFVHRPGEPKSQYKLARSAMGMRHGIWGIVAAAALIVAAPGARAGDSIAVGKAFPAWNFAPLDVGIDVGVFKKHGFDAIKIVTFAGDAKLQQALFNKSVDFGLGSGPAMAFNAKGAGGLAVSAWNGAPYIVGIMVPYDSSLAKPAQFKGKKLGVTTVGSLTDWLVRRLSQHMGWGPTGITPVALGSPPSMLAGMKTGQVDGLVIGTDAAFALQTRKEAKQVYNFGTLVPDFITNVTFARLDLIKDNPDLVRRFNAAYLEAVRYVVDHKDKTVEVTTKVLHMSADVMSRTYDIDVRGLRPSGTFEPKAVALLKQSFVEMGMLDKIPADSALYTTAFLPKH